MANSVRTAFYELKGEVADPSNGPTRVHCVIELKYRHAVDAGQCWLRAMITARELLKRMPTDTELRPISWPIAKALKKAGRLTAFPHGDVIMLAR